METQIGPCCGPMDHVVTLCQQRLSLKVLPQVQRCAQKEMVPGFQSEFQEDYQRAGFVAQLLERLPGMHEVLGSISSASNPST